MKQKQIHIIFYFFLFIILSFSSHAKAEIVSESSPGSLPLTVKTGNMSASLNSSSCVSEAFRFQPECPRKTLDDDVSCEELYTQCVETCCRKIKRCISNANTAKRKKGCLAMCEETYRACLKG